MTKTMRARAARYIPLIAIVTALPGFGGGSSGVFGGKVCKVKS